MSQTKPRYYPVRDADNPSNVTLTSINEELYPSLYRPIWRTQKQMMNLGRCKCPKSMLWSCDADCAICKYVASGNQISLDVPIDDNGEIMLSDILADEAPSPEAVIIKQAEYEALHRELNKLEPEDRRICELITIYSERKAAEIIGIPRSTLKRRWAKIRKHLYEALIDFC